MTTHVPDRTVTVPDATGHFGPYGGRFVPEALVAAIDDLTAAFHETQADPEFRAELPRLHRDYTGRPSPLTDVAQVRRARRRRPHPAQARGPQPHRLAQDQQRAGPGAAHPAHRQEARHRRDRRRPARRRHGHRGRAARPRLRRLHGRGGHPPAGAQRRPHAAARRRGRPRHHRLAHAQGRDQRGHARLGHQRRHHELRLRHRRRPAPVPADGARVPAHHRRRGARAGARARRPAARRRRCLRRRRLQRHRHLHRVRPGRAACGSSGSRRAATASRPAGTPRRSPAARRACCTARAPTCCRTTNGQTVESHSISAGLDYPGVGPEHSYLHDIGRAEYRPITDAQAMEAFSLLVAHRGHHPGDRVRARARRARCSSAASSARTR